MSLISASRICSILVVSVTMVLCLNKANYGPYTPHWHNFETCKGPKLRDLSNVSGLVYKDKDNTYKLRLNISVLVESKIESVKVTFNPLNESNKESSWKYKIDQPCKHPVVALAVLTVGDLQKCCIYKNFHTIELNLNDYTVRFIGSEFFYGDYFNRIVVTAKKGNILCFQYIMKIEKLGKH